MKMGSMAAVLAILILGLLVAAPEANAAKPDRCSPWPECRDAEPPPPEPTDGAACVDSTGDFPALAYYDTVKVGKRRKQKDINTIYVANSVGDCSIPIWSGEDIGPSGSFRFQLIENTGHIQWGLWTGTGELFHLQFDIEDRAIVTSLPLSLPEVVFGPSDGAVSAGATLSPDGNELYFSMAFQDGSNFHTIHVIDLEHDCAQLPCSATPILTNEKGGISTLAFSPDGSRLYFENADIETDPEVFRISFIEKLPGGTWSGIKHVVTNQDPGFEQAHFGGGWLNQIISVTLVDYGAGPIEVLAFNRGESRELPSEINLLSVADCDTTLPGTCLANGSATYLGLIPGELHEFTSLSSDSGIPTSSILIHALYDDGIWVFEEWDPRTFTWIRDIMVGINLNGLLQSGN